MKYVRMKEERGFLIDMPIRQFRRLLEKDEKAEARELNRTRCVCCGQRFGTVIYDGLAGRRLCATCGRREGAKRLTPRKARQHKRTSPDEEHGT